MESWIECTLTSLMLTPSSVVQLMCWREEMASRGTWTSLRVWGVYESHEAQQGQDQGPGHG